MCGIFGFYESEQHTTPAAEEVKRVLELLRHRGPDSSGTYAAPGIALAHTRLSMLDPRSCSDQPFWDEAGRYALVYNGEVYNYRELRRRLEAQGVRFRTSGDTEVVLEAIKAYGMHEAARRFDGMFALAVYDALDHTVSLCATVSGSSH